ncbi:MAG: hypothetical protein ACRYGR_05985 [Janthinobacterium lividum]
MDTMTGITETTLSFASREEYVAWRSELRTDYALLTAEIRSAKADISARYKALAATKNDTQAPGVVTLAVMQAMISDKQSQLAGMRKAAGSIMILRTEGKALARAVHAAKRALRGEAA